MPTPTLPPKASELLLDCIATFTCTELASYNQFIFYAVVTNILHLERTKLKKKLVDGAAPVRLSASSASCPIEAIPDNHPDPDPLSHPPFHPTRRPLIPHPISGPEVISVLREVPVLGRLLTSLYDCDYRGFMHALVDITPDLTRDRCVVWACVTCTHWHIRPRAAWREGLDRPSTLTTPKQHPIKPHQVHLPARAHPGAGAARAGIRPVPRVVQERAPRLHGPGLWRLGRLPRQVRGVTYRFVMIHAPPHTPDPPPPHQKRLNLHSLHHPPTTPLQHVGSSPASSPRGG